jgi:serine/threonine-protein kinase mTOR
MTREKFPEKIPFRLTRMLINAMEVTGIEGTYRRTCESVMMVLRRNKDSLMAVLEAFVYDPLLNWRLLDQPNKNHRSKGVAGDDTGESLVGSVEEQSDLMSYGATGGIRNFKTGQQQTIVDEVDANMSDNCMRNPVEVTNKKARDIVDRVKQKLTGNDFNTEKPDTVQTQIDLLILQATKNENLCQCYIGWCPFW